MFAEREYQTEAHAAIFKAWETHQSTLLELATGLGKTKVACDVIKTTFPKRVMFLAHRDELVQQAKESIEKSVGCAVQIEQADQRADTSLWGKSRVVVSTIQTQCSGPKEARRYKRFNPQEFGVVIVDEVHHATASTWKETIDHYTQNPALKVLGLTATPTRHDGNSLGQILKSIAYRYGIIDGIRDGWLVDIAQQFVSVASLDFSHLRTSAKGDFNEMDLAKLMEMEENIQGVCQPTLEVMFGLVPKTLSEIPVEGWKDYLASLNRKPRRTLFFAVSVAQAEVCASIFSRAMEGFKWVCGETRKDERRDILKSFISGEVYGVANVGVLTEGYNNPFVELIVGGRPTKSAQLYCLDEQTEILTPSGWKPGIEASVGNIVSCFDIQTSEITWQPIQEYIKRPLNHGESMLSAVGPSFDMRMTNTHRMVIRKKKTRKKIREPFKFLIAEKCSELDCFEIPVCGVQNSPGIGLTDEEIFFCGLVVTDGCYNPLNGQITLYQNCNSDWCQLFETTLVRCGFKFGKSFDKKPTNFGARKHPLCRWTISKGAPRGRDKHLSGWSRLEAYLPKVTGSWCVWEMATAKQWGMFLAGMYAGDGFKLKSPSINWTPKTLTICTNRKEWADAIQSISVRRGLRTMLAKQKSGIYYLHFKNTDFVTVRGTAKDGTRLLPCDHNASELVWCMTVPTGAFLIRRNGKVSVTGNTQILGRGTRALPGIVDDLPSADLRRGAIAQSSKPILRVLDFVGNSGKHKLVSAINVLGGNTTPEAQEKAMKKAMEGKPLRIMATMRNAEAEVEKEKHEKAERLRQLREAGKKHILAKVNYHTQNVSAFDHSGDKVTQSSRISRDGRAFSEKQANILRRHCGCDPSKLNYRQGQAIIGKKFQEWDSNKTQKKITKKS